MIDADKNYGKWTEYLTEEARKRATALGRGSYQVGILCGTENMSGSSLTGKASNWSGRYATSRRNLLARLRAAGLTVTERTGDHNKRILVIG